jgi:hypothetical protein
MRKVGILVCLICAFCNLAAAQDTFHIRVHEYEHGLDELVFEEHTNYIGGGTLHIAHEFTAGLTPTFSLGGMLLNSRRVDGGFEYAGWKVLPHLNAPATLHLPIEIGVVAEFTVQPKKYAGGSGEIEIHPILEKHLKNFTLVANPSLGRTLNLSGNSRGWAFSPAVRSAYDVSRRVTLAVEYYGESSRFLGAHATADTRLTENVVWSLGMQVGPRSEPNHIIYTSRVEVGWGHRKR